jgi:hypothetical protein
MLGENRPAPRTASQDVDLLDVLGAEGPELMARFGRWYLPERNPRYLRRNALLALGNVADGRSPAVVAVVERYLSDADVVLRATAIWVAARLGRRDLLAAKSGLQGDPSPLVQEELRRLDDVVPNAHALLGASPSVLATELCGG